MSTSVASRTFALSCIWLLFLLAQESPYAFGQNATFADNSSKPSMNQTDLSEFVNVTIPVQLLPNETLAALNLTGNSSIVNASILLNPNDPDTGDLKFYLGTLNSTNSTNNVSKHCSNVEPDYVVLAIQWPVFLCSHSLCAKDAKQNWTVHGLWPSSLRPDKKSHPEYCCNNHTFNETQLQSIRPQLADHWFSVIENRSDASFWQYEWNKHGSCHSNTSLVSYFERTLQLKEQNQVYEWLAEKGVRPSIDPFFTYNLNKIEQAIVDNVRHKIEIKCRDYRPSEGISLIDSVHFCYDRSTTNRIDCPIRRSNCLKEVVYPLYQATLHYEAPPRSYISPMNPRSPNYSPYAYDRYYYGPGYYNHHSHDIFGLPKISPLWMAPVLLASVAGRSRKFGNVGPSYGHMGASMPFYSSSGLYPKNQVFAPAYGTGYAPPVYSATGPKYGSYGSYGAPPAYHPQNPSYPTGYGAPPPYSATNNQPSYPPYSNNVNNRFPNPSAPSLSNPGASSNPSYPPYPKQPTATGSGAALNPSYPAYPGSNTGSSANSPYPKQQYHPASGSVSSNHDSPYPKQQYHPASGSAASSSGSTSNSRPNTSSSNKPTSIWGRIFGGSRSSGNRSGGSSSGGSRSGGSRSGGGRSGGGRGRG